MLIIDISLIIVTNNYQDARSLSLHGTSTKCGLFKEVVRTKRELSLVPLIAM